MKTKLFFTMKVNNKIKRIYIPEDFIWKAPLISMIITGGLIIITLILI